MPSSEVREAPKWHSGNRTGRVAQVSGEVTTTTKDGCPRCLAFGHLGEHRPWRAGFGGWPNLFPSLKWVPYPSAAPSRKGGKPQPSLSPGRVAQVSGEVTTTTKDGCPRCLAFGHLGEHRPWRAGFGGWPNLFPSLKWVPHPSAVPSRKGGKPQPSLSPGRVAQVPVEVSTTTEAGCPRCREK